MKLRGKAENYSALSVSSAFEKIPRPTNASGDWVAFGAAWMFGMLKTQILSPIVEETGGAPNDANDTG